MTKLWQLLTAELGASFKNQYGNVGETTFRYWAQELRDFDSSQIIQGFERFKKADSEWLNIKIFRRYCKPCPKELGLPDFEQSYQDLIFARWSNMPVEFRVLFSDHLFNLRRAPEAEARKRFKDLYDDAVRRIAAGEKFNIPMRFAIEQKPPQPAEPVKPMSDEEYQELQKNRELKGQAAMKNLLSMMGSHKA